MLLDELIAQLQDVREQLGHGDMPVMIEVNRQIIRDAKIVRIEKCMNLYASISSKDGATLFGPLVSIQDPNE